MDLKEGRKVIKGSSFLFIATTLVLDGEMHATTSGYFSEDDRMS